MDGSGRGHGLLRHIKNVNGVNADGADSLFFKTILEIIKEVRLIFSQRSVTVL